MRSPRCQTTARRDADRWLRPGMTIAIEPMLNIGGWETAQLDDGWTVVTADGKLSAHFEDTIAITEDGAEVLTSLDGVSRGD